MLRRDDPNPSDRSGVVGRALSAAAGPFRRMWESEDPLDAFGLLQIAGAAGDALFAIALAGTVFFDVPVGEARTKVALYLLLTMLPLAAAAPLLVPALDSGGFRRALAFGANLGRAILAAYAASILDSLVLYPVVFGALALGRVQSITRTGLVSAYAGGERSFVAANARLGRYTAITASITALPGIAVLKVAGAGTVLYLAAAIYGSAAALTARLTRPVHQERTAARRGADPGGSDVVPSRGATGVRRGRIPSLSAPSLGTAGLRGAQGFLLFLFAFALRAEHAPPWWYGAVLGAAVVGTFVGDVIAPALRSRASGGPTVFGSVVASGLVALWAAFHPTLGALSLLSGVSGAATEVGRLSFQSLMQARTPVGLQGRVFVRYEIAFQLAWIAGAFVPAMLPIGLHAGTILLAIAYGALAVLYVVVAARGSSSPSPPAAGSAISS
jgi:hypothetical protein